MCSCFRGAVGRCRRCRSWGFHRRNSSYYSRSLHEKVCLFTLQRQVRIYTVSRKKRGQSILGITLTNLVTVL